MAKTNERELKIIIGAKDAYTAVLNKAEKRVQQFSKTISASVTQATRIATNQLKIFSAVAIVTFSAIGLAAIKMAKDINESLADVATLLPGNLARIKELKPVVQDVAISVGKSTGEITKGLFQVISAFQDTADTADILKLSAQAAKAGVSTVLEAVNLATAVTRAYGVATKETVLKVFDLAFLTNRLGVTTFPELAESMGKVTSLSKTLKVSQEELFAVFATATGITGKTVEVSTQFASLLRSITDATPEMVTAVKAMGFENAEAAVNQLGLVKALRLMVDQTDLTGTSIRKLFGRAEALNLALVLTGSRAREFVTNLAAMENSSGAMLQAFKDQTDGINKTGFAFEKLKALGSVTLQKLGNVLEPFTNNLINMAISGIGTISLFIDDNRDRIRDLAKVSIKSLGGIVDAVEFLNNAYLGLILTAKSLAFAIITPVSAFFDLKEALGELEGANPFKQLQIDITKSLLTTNADLIESSVRFKFWRDSINETLESITKVDEDPGGVESFTSKISKLLVEFDELKGKLAANDEARDKRAAQLKQIKANIIISAEKAMEDQVLSLIETGKFSVIELAKVVAQTTKIELVGLAARSAVWSIFEFAMGLRDSALGLPTAAGHFASAKTFALVGGAALAGAAVVNLAVGRSPETIRKEEREEERLKRERERIERERPRTALETIQDVREKEGESENRTRIRQLIEEGFSDQQILQRIEDGPIFTPPAVNFTEVPSSQNVSETKETAVINIQIKPNMEVFLEDEVLPASRTLADKGVMLNLVAV